MKHPELQESGLTYPDGMITVKVVKQEDTEAKNGQFTIAVDTRIVKPSQFKGSPYPLRFVVGVTAETAGKLGIEEDLGAENDETWQANPSARRYASFLKACGVPQADDTDEEAENVKGAVLVIDHFVRDEKYNDQRAFYSEQDAAGTETVAAPRNADKGQNGLKRRGNGTAVRPSAPTRTKPPVDREEPADDSWE